MVDSVEKSSVEPGGVAPQVASGEAREGGSHVEASQQAGLAEHLTPMQLILALRQDTDLGDLLEPTAAGSQSGSLSSNAGEAVVELEGSDASERFYFPREISAQELHLKNFDLAPVSEGGDQLDLRDLLENAHEGALDRYLEFSLQKEAEGAAHTRIGVSRDGDGSIDHWITLEQADLGVEADTILQTMISNGNLLID